MKKILKLVACCMLGTMILSGCGEKVPTAEELVSAQFENPSKCQDMTMSMVFDVSAKIEEMSMDMKMNMNASVKMDEDTTFIDGSISMEALGMNMEENLKQYIQKNDSGVTNYQYSSDTDCWTYTTEESEESVNILETFDKSMFNDLTMVEGNKEDTFYKVQGTVDFSKVYEVMGDSLELEDSDVDFSNAKMDVIMCFDKKTKALTDMNMSVQVDTIEPSEEMEIKQFSVCCKFNEVGEGFNVEVPKDVIENSESADYESEPADWSTNDEFSEGAEGLFGDDEDSEYSEDGDTSEDSLTE